MDEQTDWKSETLLLKRTFGTFAIVACKFMSCLRQIILFLQIKIQSNIIMRQSLTYNFHLSVLLSGLPDKFVWAVYTRSLVHNNTKHMKYKVKLTIRASIVI